MNTRNTVDINFHNEETFSPLSSFLQEKNRLESPNIMKNNSTFDFSVFKIFFIIVCLNVIPLRHRI